MRLTGVLAVILAVLLAAVCPAMAGPPDSETDIQAEVLLKASCATLAALKSYSFTAEIDRDFAYPTGDSVRISQTVLAKVQRPDHFRCDMQGDDRDGTIVYDGTALHVLDLDANVYGTMEGKGSTDATVKEAIEKYRIQAPLANLLFADPCGSMNLDKVTGRYLGVHMAAGRSCHHLIFFGQDLNWQIWIDESDSLPRKIVITDKSLPGWPQYSAVLSKWNTAAHFAAGTFAFKPPKGAHQAPVIPIGQGAIANPGEPGKPATGGNGL